MAEPDDPQPDAPPAHDDFDDDLVGFVSPRALQGAAPVSASMTPREPWTTPPELAVGDSDSDPEPEADIFAAQSSGSSSQAESDRAVDAESEMASPSEPLIAPETVTAPDPADVQVVDPEPWSEADSEPEQNSVSTAAVAAAVVVGDAMASAPSTSVDHDPMNTPIDDRAAPDGDVEPPGSYGEAGATRTFERPPPPREPGIMAEGDARFSVFVYACLIAAGFTGGATALVALVLAWMGRFRSQGWVESHFVYQLRTSLIGVIAAIVGALTLPLGLGVFILSLNVVWLVVRGAAGLFRLLRREEIRDPRTWGLP